MYYSNLSALRCILSPYKVSKIVICYIINQMNCYSIINRLIHVTQTQEVIKWNKCRLLHSYEGRILISYEWSHIIYDYLTETSRSASSVRKDRSGRLNFHDTMEKWYSNQSRLNKKKMEQIILRWPRIYVSLKSLLPLSNSPSLASSGFFVSSRDSFKHIFCCKICPNRSCLGLVTIPIDLMLCDAPIYGNWTIEFITRTNEAICVQC